ncbi:hypothetical protein JCM15519_21070 [Fundidesulfovibrio butyratiphilus]
MSGPKTGGWRLVDASEPHITWAEAQNILREYLAKIMSLRDQLIALQKRHPELVIHYGVEDMRTDVPGSGQVVVDEMNNRLDIYRRLRGEIQRIEGIIDVRRSLLAMAKSVGNKAAARRSRKEESGDSTEELRQTALRVAGRVAPGLRERDMAEINNLVRDIMTEKGVSDSRLQTMVDSLRILVDRANASVRESKRRQEIHAKEAARLMTELLGVESAESQAITQALRRVENGELPLDEDLRSRAKTEAEKARQAKDRRKAADIMRQSLIRLGYGVEEDFSTFFVSGGNGYFQHPNWTDHYCRLSVNPTDKIMNFDIVRLGEGEHSSRDETLEDQEIERQWCSVFPELLNELRAEGLEYQPLRALAPGALSVQRVTDARLESRRTNVASANARQMRQP